MQAWFHDVVNYLCDLLGADQRFTCRVTGEDSDMVRFNGGRIRQAGSVTQRELALQLIEGDRQVRGTLELTGDIAADRFPLRQLHDALSTLVREAPPDPHLCFPDAVSTTEDREDDRLPPTSAVLPLILAEQRDLQPVGIYMAGRIAEGVATSSGLRRWYETHTFDLDLSLCLGLGPRERDRSVKLTLGGTRWDPAEVEHQLATAAAKAERLRADRVRVAPGAYRTYIAPSGWKMILRTLGWRGAFSHRAVANGTSPFAALHRGERLSTRVSISENHSLGWTAPFSPDGFRRRLELPLVEEGRVSSVCVAPRTALEYGVPHTGATAEENPGSIEVAAGDLPLAEIPERIGDGLYLDHLHYLNLSDRGTASVTGLTRFAAFRVRDGRIAEPLEIVRFDDSVLQLLGERLIGLTAERERLPEGRSYHRRALGGALLPGAIVEGLRIVS